MASQIASILHALYEEDSWPTPDCPTCDSQLAAFVDAELAGAAVEARFPAVAAHLAHCSYCQQAHQELHALLRLERAEKLAVPSAPASFNFSYLPSRLPAAAAPAQPKPWRLDALGRLVIEFTAELLRNLPGPALQPAMLKGDAPPAGLRYVLADAVEDLAVRIEVEPQRRNPQRLTIEVEVDIPSRGGWPHLAGNVVTLRRGAELIDKQETDSFGKALFDGVPAADLPQLVFEIAQV